MVESIEDNFFSRLWLWIIEMIWKLHHRHTLLLTISNYRLLYFQASLFNHTFAMLFQEHFFVIRVASCNYCRQFSRVFCLYMLYLPDSWITVTTAKTLTLSLSQQNEVELNFFCWYSLLYYAFIPEHLLQFTLKKKYRSATTGSTRRRRQRRRIVVVVQHT